MIYPGVGLIFCLPMCFTFSPCLRDVKGQTGSLHVLIEEIGWGSQRLWLADSFREGKGMNVLTEW
jgi:hypothetical protein